MKIKINSKITIETGKKPLLVAEISANHGGNKKLFLNHISAAHKSGADLIKIQTYEPKDITLRKYSNNFKIKKGIWKNKYLWDLYEKAHTPFIWHFDAFKLAKRIGATLFSTPFSTRAVDLLEKFNVPIYKVASLEITDDNLIEKIAKTKKPIILSTGVSTYTEIYHALNIIKKYHSKIILLHCISGYPTPMDEINLSRIDLIKKKFKTSLVGLSDHTDSIDASLGSIFYEVCLIEKHFTINSKSLDAKFSLNKKEFIKLSIKLKNNYQMIGNKTFTIKNSEKDIKKLRRSIFTIKNIKKNEVFSKKNTSCLRPFIGLNSNLYFKVLGKKSKKNIKINTPLKKSMIKYF